MLALCKGGLKSRHGPDGEGSPIRLFFRSRSTELLFPWLYTALLITRSAVRTDAEFFARHAPNSIFRAIYGKVTRTLLARSSKRRHMARNCVSRNAYVGSRDGNGKHIG